eukprot:7386142-Prymnesium_polylepis.1
MGSAPPKWVLPISSVNEDKLLKILGLTMGERSQIEGLAQRRRSSVAISMESGVVVREEQQTTSALIRLATNPPPEVGNVQRRTRSWLLRP